MEERSKLQKAVLISMAAMVVLFGVLMVLMMIWRPQGLLPMTPLVIARDIAQYMMFRLELPHTMTSSGLTPSMGAKNSFASGSPSRQP